MSNSETPNLVVHIVYALGTGGLENGMINIINRMPADRYRHAIICIKQSGEFAERITAPGVEIIELHKREGHDFGLYWRLLKTLIRLRPAIVHTRNIAAIEAQFLAALLPGVRGVHGEHGRDIYDVAGGNRKYRWLRRALSPFISRFIAVSKDLGCWLAADVGVPRGKIVQIYNGVDLEKFSPGTRADIKGLPHGFTGEHVVVIGTVGRLAAIKDQAVLIRAVRELRNRTPELAHAVRLIIVGDGPLRQDLQQQIDEASLNELCWMAGNRDDIPHILRCMDIFVLPSLGEGISNTILEAMASGLPIVASRVGGNPELVSDEDNGLLFPAGDTDALVEALTRLCIDPVRRQAMASSSRARVKRDFNWDKTVDHYCRVYNGLMGVNHTMGVA